MTTASSARRLEIAAAVRAAANAFKSTGMSVDEKRPPLAEKAGDVYFDISRGDGGAGVRAFLNSVGTNQISPLFDTSLQKRSAPALGTITDALAAFNRCDTFRNGMLEFMQGYDVLLAPVAPFVAPKHGTGFDAHKINGYGYGQMHNLTGWPTVTVRVGTSPEGMPIGVQVSARPWREDVALAMARHLETTFGGWKMPAI